ncbi:hypothetical protein A2W67_00600 [Candidatus Nomurabacteria bacterium RIFCSPLOWO2_02_40_28]|nr:MAG: hypothetical protein A2W50_01905 [Candidatus Nomurabacteria bacterium RIFCSPHIGHO2_02_40_30]OGI79998.1 MAG: hypothetical protein A2W43_02465 [Candidatus Nomurabacteria bacterium RIFCSPHIGHO2_12_40_11]OGI96534.1 MAG: hypothetical protein A2W67_00600 [Candidatus Nomurabacteria bacterium RIFCSPLOWO2_02_40_28]HBG68717.1 hypothetical protein [Candidatus Nomurabacteria bacterium]
MLNFFKKNKACPQCLQHSCCRRGFMVIEILIVASIITVSILAAMAVSQKSIYVMRQAFHATQAGFLLEEGAEAVRILRDNAWSNISSLTAGTNYYTTFSGGTWTLSATANTVGIFTRTVTVASVSRDNVTKDIVTSGGTDDTGTKLVTVTVFWSEAGTTVTKTLKFYIINIFS